MQRKSMRERTRERASRVKGMGLLYTFEEGIKPVFYREKVEEEINLDIIPYVVTMDNHPDEVEKGDLFWVLTVPLHKNVGASKEKLVCPRFKNLPCPICEEVDALSENYDANSTLIKNIRSKDMDMFNVIDTEDRDKGPQIWTISPFCFTNMLDRKLKRAKDDSPHLDFAELEGGSTLDLVFVVDTSGKYKFNKVDEISFSKRAKDYPEDILKEGFPLDKIVRILDYDKIAAMFFGGSEGDSEETESKDDAESESPADQAASRQAKENASESISQTTKSPSEEEEEQEEQETKELDPDACVACEGAGKSSNGRKCKPCKGAGKKEEDKKEEAKEEEPSGEKEKTKEDTTSTEKSGDEKCPSGFKYGIDTDQPHCREVCLKCDLWPECFRAKSNNKAT